MGIISSEYGDRLEHWIRTLKEDFYTPLGQLSWKMFRTMEQLSLEEAKAQDYRPAEPGATWGNTYEYGWFFTEVRIPYEAEGKMIALDLNPGGESTVFVNGKPFGTYRADWVKQKHHYVEDNILTWKAKGGEHFEIYMETYAGHYYPEERKGRACATGPVLPGLYRDWLTEGARRTLGEGTFGIWDEDAYQLYMDVETLRSLFKVLDEDSLRASKIADGLEAFTLTVDFEQGKEARTRDYQKARQRLSPFWRLPTALPCRSFLRWETRTWIWHGCGPWPRHTERQPEPLQPSFALSNSIKTTSIYKASRPAMKCAESIIRNCLRRSARR